MLGDLQTVPALDQFIGVTSFLGNVPFDAMSDTSGQTYPTSWGFDVHDPTWPRHLPNVSILRHL